MNEFLGDRSIKRGMSAALILLAVFLLIQSINGLKENSFIGKGDSFQTTISVSGEGEVTAIPDIATFSFSVEEEKDAVDEAQSSLSENVSKVLDSLKEFGLEEKNIKTLSYNIYPRYEYYTRQRVCPEGFACPPASGERVLVGYTASQTVSLEIEEIEKAGEVLSILGKNGADNVNGPTFDFSNREELVREARKMAIDDAKEKAKQLSKDLGVKLVGVVNFWENGNSKIARSESFDLAIAEGSFGGNVAPEIPIGEGEIFSRVEIVYEIK